MSLAKSGFQNGQFLSHLASTGLGFSSQPKLRGNLLHAVSKNYAFG